MRHVAFVEFLAQLNQLTPEQRKRRVRQFMGRESDTVPRATVPLAAPTGCPHCGASVDRLGSWGQSQGLKRYRCRVCGRTFNALTGAALAHLRKREQWTRYAELLIEGSVCARPPAVARSTKTLRFGGAIASFATPPGTGPNVRPGS